jgi:peptidylprolyl isomerase
MRRIAVLLAPLMLATLALTGCGGSSPSAANSAVTVKGHFDKEPTVSIPAEKATATLDVKTLIHGTGPTLTSTDALVGNYVVYIWSGTTHKLAQSTYAGLPALFTGRLLPGLTTALHNQKVGSRVLAVIPPKYGYGTRGNSSGGVKPTDTLVFVIDVLKAYGANATATGTPVSNGGHGLPVVTPGAPPHITMPTTAPPQKLVTKTLIQGSGKPVTAGQYAIVQYVGALWRTGKVFDSSWARGTPFGFVFGTPPTAGGLITGWTTGLTGVKAGSRVLLSIPPSDGYGSKGYAQAGIRPKDTLVFVVDVLGSYGKAA